MKNFEKYEEKLKNTGICFGIDNETGDLIDCDKDHSCKKCIFTPNYECNTKKMAWLYEEHKEPLLTNGEKEYLKAVIRPFRNKDIWVIKSNGVLYIDGKNYIGDGITISLATISLITYEFKLSKLEEHKKYTLEELGIKD